VVAGVSPAWKRIAADTAASTEIRGIQQLPLRTAAATVCRVKQSNLVHDGEGWETISSERHFGNAHLEVVTDHVRTPTREAPRTWTVVHRKAAVIIAPMTRDGKIVLIRQERVPIRAAIWEMPSGQIDNAVAPHSRGDPGHKSAQSIKAVALSELREEAGYELSKDGELIALGHYFSSPGFTDERGYFFLARPVQPCADYVRDEAESIVDCREFSIEELRRMIAATEISDANTLSMWARLVAGGFLSPEGR
jgi:ADP-ribose pyrophosphatase